VQLSRITGNLFKILLCAVLITGSTLAFSKQLILADSFPTSHWLSKDGTVWWMHRVEKLSGGDLTFQHFPAGQLAKASELLQKVQDNVAQAGYVGTGYASAELPLNNAPMLPGQVDDVVAASQAYWKLLKSDSLMRKEFINAGVVPVYAILLPPYQMVLNRPPAMSLAAFKGLKLRTTGSIALVAEALGASPVNMASPESYLAMQRGTLDGTVLSVTSVEPYKLNEVTKSISTNGKFGSFGITVVMNADTYNNLSQKDKNAIAKAGDETTTHLAQVAQEQVKIALSHFRQQGLKVYEFPPKMLKALQPKYEQAQTMWLKRMDERGLDGKEALKEYRDALAAEQ
jgi:TRAP-type C4-dicarboxylate transport system substrate-binding protein